MKYLLLLALTGCAGLQANVLPEAGTALQGVTAFYAAVCTEPLPVNAPVCEDVKPNLNKVVDFYDEVNETFGESE